MRVQLKKLWLKDQGLPVETVNGAEETEALTREHVLFSLGHSAENE